MPFHWTAPGAVRQSCRVSLLLALLACWFGGMPAWATTVQGVDIRADRIVIHFDGAVTGASAFAVDTPQRLVVDIDGASPGARARASGPVTAVRQAARDKGGLRVVFDLAQPAVIADGSFANGGHDLTLQLATADDATFARAAQARSLRFVPPFSYASAAAALPRYQISRSIPAVSRTLALPRVYGDDASRPLVVIDAGHGGFDPGAISPLDGRREKDVTLRIAKAIRDELLASGRVRVALTREDDRFLVLQERYGLARKLHADLFISIHCDSVGAGDASGASVYTLSEVASDKEAARLAARENKADVISGVNLASTTADVSSILIDLTQRETMNASAGFARLLGREAQPLMPMKPNFHRMASLMVLKAPDLPSILFETGYISNPRDADFIDSTAGREKIAQAVRKAVEVHFARKLAAND